MINEPKEKEELAKLPPLYGTEIPEITMRA